MPRITALLAGLLFGMGLLLSGMSNPQKVIGFLDVAGDWDPSLAFVMFGAISAAIVPFSWAKRHSRTLLDTPMRLPDARRVDRRLISGSLLFGIGWGIAGLCPGPALTGLLAGYWQTGLFVVAMLCGMWLFTALDSRRAA